MSPAASACVTGRFWGCGGVPYWTSAYQQKSHPRGWLGVGSPFRKYPSNPPQISLLTEPARNPRSSPNGRDSARDWYKSRLSPSSILQGNSGLGMAELYFFSARRYAIRRSNHRFSTHPLPAEVRGRVSRQPGSRSRQAWVGDRLVLPLWDAKNVCYRYGGVVG